MHIKPFSAKSWTPPMIFQDVGLIVTMITKIYIPTASRIFLWKSTFTQILYLNCFKRGRMLANMLLSALYPFQCSSVPNIHQHTQASNLQNHLDPSHMGILFCVLLHQCQQHPALLMVWSSLSFGKPKTYSRPFVDILFCVIKIDPGADSALKVPRGTRLAKLLNPTKI